MWNWKIVRKYINEATSMFLFFCRLDKSFMALGRLHYSDENNLRFWLLKKMYL